jgi:hypothetical protein
MNKQLRPANNPVVGEPTYIMNIIILILENLLVLKEY